MWDSIFKMRSVVLDVANKRVAVPTNNIKLLPSRVEIFLGFSVLGINYWCF